MMQAWADYLDALRTSALNWRGGIAQTVSSEMTGSGPGAAAHAPGLDLSETDIRGSLCGNTAQSLRSRSCPHERGIEHLDERRTIVGVRLPFIELNELLNLGLDRVLGLLRVGHHHVPQLRFGLG